MVPATACATHDQRMQFVLNRAMRMKQFVFACVILTTVPAFAIAEQGGKSASEETLHFEGFGVVHIYRVSSHPGNIVLFVSGRGGWTGPVVEMAKELAAQDSLVVGIDANRFLASLTADEGQCSHYSYSFEDLDHYVQQKLGFPRYTFPFLVGYSTGATIVYSALVQSHTGVFRAAISLDFCPSLSLPVPPCRGSGLEWSGATNAGGKTRKEYIFRAAPDLATPWIVLQPQGERSCGPNVVRDFVKRTGQARLVEIPAAAPGLSLASNRLHLLAREYAALLRTEETRAAVPAAPEVRDLPLEKVPATGPQSDSLAVIISGDGGWAGIDRDLAQLLAAEGIPVVGINSLQYFWTRRTPETAAADLSRILRHYLAAWNKRRAILAGYSMGADVLTFMAARLPADLQSRVALIALLGLSATVDFEFHFTEWLGGISRKTDLRVLPEVEKLKGKKILCVYGLEEGDDICRTLSPGLVQPVALKGGHHFGGDYKTIADLILKESK